MTDPGDKLAKRYREICPEEPPAALDEAILAASRRAVARDSRAQRWLAPVSIAAVLVLAFGITLEMQREEPAVATMPPGEANVTAPSPPVSKNEARVAAPSPPVLKKEGARRESGGRADIGADKDRAEPRAMADAAAPMRRAAPATATIPAPGAAPAPQAPAANVASDSAAPPAPESAPPPARASAAPPAPEPAAPASGAAALQSFARAKVAAPADLERELERIARLRADGRNEEADKALEAFRREHPDYRIAEAMWERVRAR